MSVPQYLRIARFILIFLGEHRGGETNGLHQPSNASDELRQVDTGGCTQGHHPVTRLVSLTRIKYRARAA